MTLDVEVYTDNLDEDVINELHERFEVYESSNGLFAVLYDEQDLADLEEIVGKEYHPVAPTFIDERLFEEIIENYAKEYFDAEEIEVSSVDDLVEEYLGEIDEDAANLIEQALNHGCVDADDVIQNLLERKYEYFEYEYIGDKVVVFGR